MQIVLKEGEFGDPNRDFLHTLLECSGFRESDEGPGIWFPQAEWPVMSSGNTAPFSTALQEKRALTILHDIRRTW